MVDGEYVQNGDVMEWQWDEDQEATTPTINGGWVVPEGEFDPTSAPPPEVSPAERPQENPSPGLVLAEAPEVAEEAEEEEEEDDLENLTKEELQDLLAERDLPTSGNKPDLIERLRA